MNDLTGTSGDDGTDSTLQPQPSTGHAPVAETERIASIDVLRGVALLGILTINIPLFSMIEAVLFNPTAYGDFSGANRVVWILSYLFGDQKFMTLFSMLFGAGIVLMAERAESKSLRPAGLHYRRMFWLMVIGSLHGYLLWFGDILYCYAVCGLVLYPLRRWRPAVLISVGLVLMLAIVPIGLGFGYMILPEMKAAAVEAMEAERSGETLTEEQVEALETWEGFDPPPEKIEEEIEAYRNGYVAQVVFRAPLVLQFQTVLMVFIGFWMTAGLFCSCCPT